MSDFDRSAQSDTTKPRVLGGHPSLRTRLYQYRYVYLMLLPGVIYVLIINYLPMFGAIIAFKRVNYALGIFRSPWIGFENFKFLFGSKGAWLAMWNTLAYNIVFIFTGPIFSVALAVMLNEVLNKRVVKVYQTLIILPYFVSYVVGSYLLFAFLSQTNGYFNTTVFPALGLEPVKWYLNPKPWPFVLFLVNGWKTWGFGTVIYLATMSGFDPELYEAAVIDGAGRWTQIRRITLPLLLPIIVLLIILSLGRIFYSDFGLFYQVPRESGLLIPTTQTLDTFVYRALIQISDVGMSSAASLFQSVVGFVTILTANLIIRRLRPEWSVF